MNDILYSLCLHSTDIMDGWTPIPARLIAKSVGVSLYKARKELCTLKENGYAYTFSLIIDPEETILPYHGWGITEAARETEEYKKAAHREAEICEECFNIPKSQMLSALLKGEYDEK